MPAPAGTCGSCKMPLSWSFAAEVLVVRCRYCGDLFEEPLGMILAGNNTERARDEDEVHCGEYQKK